MAALSVQDSREKGAFWKSLCARLSVLLLLLNESLRFGVQFLSRDPVCSFRFLLYFTVWSCLIAFSWLSCKLLLMKCNIFSFCCLIQKTLTFKERSELIFVTNLKNRLSLFSWLNKQTDLKGQHRLFHSVCDGPCHILSIKQCSGYLIFQLVYSVCVITL